MRKPDLKRTTNVREALGSVRESLFVVAEEAGRLKFSGGPNDLIGLIQSANYSLGNAERELARVAS